MDSMTQSKQVNSVIGETYLDSGGSAIGASRMDPAEAYNSIPSLLQEYINTGSAKSWEEIKQKIDNIYFAIDCALGSLESEVPFSEAIKARVGKGQRLFFKPNLVTQPSIDFQTHAPSLIGSCTPWEFVAALMRWFHDRMDISYHMMSLGEGGTNASLAAATAAKTTGNNEINTLSMMEGKTGQTYGGWGFYFIRRYLADNHQPGHGDNPMNGYEESLAGICLPPGTAKDKLLLYDINKISEKPSNGREVPVAGGVNFKSIVLHKALVGGDPDDPDDRRDWPGSVVINVPKMKIHQLELLTSAVKNLGVGIYPMECNSSSNSSEIKWRYALPNLPLPSFKVKLPHRRWEIAFDEKTGLPVSDGNGSYEMNRTGGMEATLADALQALKGQDIFMFHIVDAIETSNIAHTGPATKPVQEGFVFASCDPVALDEMALRFLFNNVPLEESNRIRQEHRLSSDVIQRVPLARAEGNNIITAEGYDSAYSRYNALRYCEERGLGRREFHVAGKDLWHGGDLASLGSRLGRVQNGAFSELFAATMYYTEMSLIWYLQQTSFSYLKANDALTGSTYEKDILEAYDENGDGVIDFMERGKGTLYGTMPYGARLAMLDTDPGHIMKLRFLLGLAPLKLLKKEWNSGGYMIGDADLLANAVALAFIMSKSSEENSDPFFPEMKWGKGKWPSLQLALNRQLCRLVFGPAFPTRCDLLMSPFGQVFRYADSRHKQKRYCTPESLGAGEDIIGGYHKEVDQGAPPLPFVFYVPTGFLAGTDTRLPNVKETDDPALVFTASFKEDNEWKDLDLAEIP